MTHDYLAQPWGTRTPRTSPQASGRNGQRAYDPTSVGQMERQYAHFDDTLSLHSGAKLAGFTLAYETYGQLNADRSNAILICHALSGDAHVAGYHTDDPAEKPGWWDEAVGPSKMFDTNRYLVICSNVIGGCQGSTGPSAIAPDGKPYGLRFPVVTVADMVLAQRYLIDYLGITTLLAVAGGSMGGMQALQWAVDYPDRVENVLFIASAVRSSAQNIAFNEIGRQAIYADPRWNGGDYYAQAEYPDAGLAVARMVGHITYMSETSLEQKFGRRLQERTQLAYGFETDFAVESYFQHQGSKFTERFDANSYLYITKALDYYDVAEGYPSLEAALSRVTADFLVLSFTSDWLYTDRQARELVDSLARLNRRVEYHCVEAFLGHDSFLVEVEIMTELVGGYLNRNWRRHAALRQPAAASAEGKRTSGNGKKPTLPVLPRQQSAPGNEFAEVDWPGARLKTLALKFGGTSVGSRAAIESLLQIVAAACRSQAERVIVVASAMNGVTDRLQSGILAAAQGDTVSFQQISRDLREKHAAVLQALAPDELATTLAEIDSFLQGYHRCCESVAVLGEATPRALDYTMGLGERLSVRQIAAALRARGIPAQAIDATGLIVTDDCFQNAAPDLDLTRQNLQQTIAPLLDAGCVPVITGYIGATTGGISTTLGRGGSDYSAAIIGAGLDCDEIWIWTDVDGVMTADPRIVLEARTIVTLTYQEISELAYYGAKVLHPKTVRPALEAGIPIRVKNTFNPRHPSTLIVHHTEAIAAVTAREPVAPTTTQPFKAVTAIKNMGMITVEGKGMLGVPGIAARTFSAVAATGTNVLLISQSSSEQSICFLIPGSDVDTVVHALNGKFEREITRRDIDRIASQAPLTIITVVGDGILRTPGIAAQIFGAIALVGVNVIAIAQGSSACGISLVVAAVDTETAVRGIHSLLRDWPVAEYATTVLGI